MKNLVINGEEYTNIFLSNDGTIKKYSSKSVGTWERLVSKKLDFLVNPLDARNLTKEEKGRFPNSKSLITLPFYESYQTFEEKSFSFPFMTGDLLTLFKYHLSLLKKSHQEDVIIVDMNAGNLLINEDNDIKFNDLDAALVDGDKENAELCYDDNARDVTLLKRMLISEDKRCLMEIYLNYLASGSFKRVVGDSVRSGFMFPCTELKNKALSYLDDELIMEDDYFEELVDGLISYERAVELEMKKVLGKYH